MRVTQHQPEKLAPCIPARSGYRDLYRHANNYAFTCKIIQSEVAAVL
jgi:hypothetical protein